MFFFCCCFVFCFFAISDVPINSRSPVIAVSASISINQYACETRNLVAAYCSFYLQSWTNQMKNYEHPFPPVLYTREFIIDFGGRRGLIFFILSKIVVLIRTIT